MPTQKTLADKARQDDYKRIVGGFPPINPKLAHLSAGDLEYNKKTRKWRVAPCLLRAPGTTGGSLVPLGGPQGGALVPLGGPQGAGVFQDIGKIFKRGAKRAASGKVNYTPYLGAVQQLAPIAGPKGQAAADAITALQSTAAGRKAIRGRAGAEDYIKLGATYGPGAVAALRNVRGGTAKKTRPRRGGGVGLPGRR